MKLVRIFAILFLLFNLSACTDCGSKSFIYGSCDISQDSQSNGVSLLAKQSKRPYMTEQEDWKRRISFSGMAGDFSSVKYYCYFMEESEAGYQNAEKEECSNQVEKYHDLPWENISSLDYRENYLFVVEGIGLETGKSESIATFKLDEELSHIEKFIDCDYIPTSTFDLTSYLSSSTSMGKNVCISDNSINSSITASISLGSDSLKVYGREPAPDSTEKPPRLVGSFASGYLIMTNTKNNFELHGVVLESDKSGMSGYIYADVPVKLSFINARAGGGQPEAFVYLYQTSRNSTDNESLFDSIHLKVNSVKNGIVVKGGHGDVLINNLKAQMNLPIGATGSTYGLHIIDANQVKVTQSTFDILSEGHAVKMEASKLYLSKNEFIQRIDNKQLFLIVDGASSKEIELAGNRYVRKDESPGTPDPIFQVTASDGVSFTQSKANDGTAREWGCYVDSSVANFSSYIFAAGGGSVNSRPLPADLHAFQGNGINSCEVIPDAAVISSDPEKWDQLSYGFQGNGSVE